ncbi:MAG TPA: hypothetical protein VFU46_05790 [Gemmatimonadales bacterium]|nr:hypothetical protein [Gemmatimonadales bacterium]
MMRRACAAAPVRLDFAGGWTDVPPFSAREGGAVVNAAIALYVRAEVQPGGAGIRLRSEDLGQRLELSGPAQLAADGCLDLPKAALRMFGVAEPLALVTSADVPKGAGLGSSGALDVAMVAALSAARGAAPPPLEMANLGWRLEAVEARVPGGRQDQCAAALGGFNLLRFRDPDLTVERLELDPGFAAELARRIVLCYTGASRVSGDTIARVMGAYDRGEPRVAAALRSLRHLAEEMAGALRATDVARVGCLLSENWREQCALDDRMRTPAMARLETAMGHAGALGGKAAGAGAGGCMFFLAGDDVGAARRAAAGCGCELLPVEWEPRGVRAC